MLSAVKETIKRARPQQIIIADTIRTKNFTQF